MDLTTIRALEAYPQQLEAYFWAIPTEFRNWKPASWDGVPSEPFSAIEQICHVHDIEIEGYHVRIERTLHENSPVLESIDGAALATSRRYATAESGDVLAAFRAARSRTISLVRALGEGELNRKAHFDGYGKVTLRSLIHFLCSHDQQHLAGLQWLLGKIEVTRDE